MIKNSFIYTISNMFNRAIPFLLLPVLTRYLSPEEFGKVAMFLVVMMLVMPLVGVCSNSVLSQRYFRMTNRGRKLMVNDIIKLLFMGTLFLFVVLYVFGGWLEPIINLDKKWLLVSLGCGAMGMLATIVLTLYQLEKKVYSYAFFQGGATLLNVGFSLLFVVLLGWGWEGRVDGIFFSAILTMLVVIYILHRHQLYQPIDFFSRAPYLTKVMRLGIAIIPASIAGWAMVMTDRVFISSMLGLDAVGIYAVALYFGQAGEVVMTSIARAWVPFFYSGLASGKKADEYKVIKTTYLLCILYALIALVLAIVGPLLFKFFVDEAYYSGGVIIPWLAFSFFCIAVMGLASLFLMDIKRNDILSKIYIVVLLFNVVLNFVMIEKFGILGAAMATGLANLLGLVVTIVVTVRLRSKLSWMGVRK